MMCFKLWMTSLHLRVPVVRCSVPAMLSLGDSLCSKLMTKVAKGFEGKGQFSFLQMHFCQRLTKCVFDKIHMRGPEHCRHFPMRTTDVPAAGNIWKSSPSPRADLSAPPAKITMQVPTWSFQAEALLRVFRSTASAGDICK